MAPGLCVRVHPFDRNDDHDEDRGDQDHDCEDDEDREEAAVEAGAGFEAGAGPPQPQGRGPEGHPVGEEEGGVVEEVAAEQNLAHGHELLEGG